MYTLIFWRVQRCRLDAAAGPNLVAGSESAADPIDDDRHQPGCRREDQLAQGDGARLGSAGGGPAPTPSTIETCRSPVLWSQSLNWPPTVEQFEAIARRPGLSAWMVGDDEDQAAWGHFDLTLQGASARLGRVIIDPRYRGRGLGHTLIRSALEKARNLGADEVRLAVVTDNAPAVRTYRRAGFEELVDPERPTFTAMRYHVRAYP
jgi:GNAT superfamily N-acetyltransferase